MCHGDVPATQHGRNLAKRFGKHGEGYFRFITTPGVEPTNNLAEQAIRFVVIDRQITQGTRSETGPLVRADLDGDRDVRASKGDRCLSTWRRRSGRWFAGTEPPLLLPGD